VKLEMMHRLKITWVMKAAHMRASEKRNQFNTYKDALSNQLRKMWAVANGKSSDEFLDNSFASFMFDEIVLEVDENGEIHGGEVFLTQELKNAS
jgi:hypothetical protein